MAYISLPLKRGIQKQKIKKIKDYFFLFKHGFVDNIQPICYTRQKLPPEEVKILFNLQFELEGKFDLKLTKQTELLWEVHEG